MLHFLATIASTAGTVLYYAVLAVVTYLFLAMTVFRIVRKIHPFPVPWFVGYYLDSKFRRWMEPTKDILERSGVQKGYKILEVGCGSGCYTPYFAERVGEEGTLFALDIESLPHVLHRGSVLISRMQQHMLDQLGAKLSRAEYRGVRDRVTPVLGNAYELPYEDNTFDLVYMITVLPEIPDRVRALREVRRVLKPGAVFADTEFLPDPDYVLSSTVMRLGEEAGFDRDKMVKKGSFFTYTVTMEKL